MEFPVTVDSQDDFDKLVKDRLEREKNKQSDLEKQVEALTAEKQDLTSKLTDLEGRATTAEKWKADREAQDAINKTRDDVAKEFGLTASVLRGASEEELRAHAEELKPLLAQPISPVLPGIGDSPTNDGDTEAHQAVRQLFGTD